MVPGTNDNASARSNSDHVASSEAADVGVSRLKRTAPATSRSATLTMMRAAFAALRLTGANATVDVAVRVFRRTDPATVSSSLSMSGWAAEEAWECPPEALPWSV